MRKPRLGRLELLFTKYPVYFITACTHERQRVLASAEIRAAFIAFASKAEEYGVFVGRYVIMPDHLHLFVTFAPDSEKTLSEWVKSFKNTLSKTLRQSGYPAPHWQKGFFDHVLRSSESYSEKWEYVCQNPLRAGLVKTPEEWPFQGEIHELSL